ncbi:putative substrate-binding protein [Escherichia coli]|uniref:Putative substrate-binding protein n=1 Tax=Escherichia coli TaxID=562 RepID=A0A376U1Z1_ECOLX|nr:putative substrate-binding protein [Escherichia coli]
MLKGPQGEEKEIESRLEEGCYYLLFDSRTHRGANQQVRDWVSYVLSPTNLVYFAEEQYQQLWFPAYGLLPPLAPCPHHKERKTGWPGKPHPDLLSGSQ